MREIGVRKKWPVFFRILKWFSISVFALILLFSALAFVIVRYYEDSIKALFISELNKRLNSEITVKDIDLSLYQQFPYATLLFTDLLAKDAIKDAKKDTLLFAHKVYLNFNVLDFYDGKYVIKRIDIDEGVANIKVFQDLTDNYHFWKTDSVKSAENFAFALDKVVIDKTRFAFQNYHTEQHYGFYLHHLIFRGKFNQSQYDLKTKGDMLISQIRSGRNVYIRNRESRVDIDFRVDQDKKEYQVRKGLISLGKLNFDVGGHIVLSDENKFIKVRVNARETEISSFIEYLPYQYNQYLKDYKAEGEVSFLLNLSGSFGGEKLPGLQVNFGVRNAELTYKKTGISVRNINFKGEFENHAAQKPEDHLLRLTQVSGQLQHGSFHGMMNINGFKNTEIITELFMDANLQELGGFFKQNFVDDLQGQIKGQIHYKGRPKDIENLTEEDFLNSEIDGNLWLKDLSGKFKTHPVVLEKTEAEFSFNRNDVIVKYLKGSISGSDFRVKGSLKNLFPYLFIPAERLHIDADIISNNADLDKLLAVGVSKRDTLYKLELPKQLDGDIRLNIGKFNFRRFNGRNLVCGLRYYNRKLYLNGLEMLALGGKIHSDAQIDGGSGKDFFLNFDAKLQGVDVTRMCNEFENFGQAFITGENLKGTMDADVQLSFFMKPDLGIDPASIVSNAEISIENGALINYKPIYGLGKFIRVEDLSDIRFESIKNQFSIKDKKVIIPEMDVRSDAINFVLAGTHTFNNEINYKIQVLLSEILSKKAKKAKKENTEFGIEQDDHVGRTTLYILLTGTVDKPVFKYDSKSVKGKIVADFLNEKRTLKKMFKEEFSRSRRGQDSIRSREKAMMKQQEGGKFIVEWEGNRTDTMNAKKDSRKVKPEKKKIVPAKAKKSEKIKPEIKVDWE